MNWTDAEIALEARLVAGTAGVQFLFPNLRTTAAPPVAPYAVVTISPDATTDMTMTGVVPMTRGRMLVVIVGTAGQGTLQAGRIRDQVVALFPMGLKLRPAYGIIEFPKPPQPKPGYEQAGNWRVPVEIGFLAS